MVGKTGYAVRSASNGGLAVANGESDGHRKRSTVVPTEDIAEASPSSGLKRSDAKCYTSASHMCGGSKKRPLARGQSKKANNARAELFRIRHGNDFANSIQESRKQIEEVLRRQANSSKYVLHPDKTKSLNRWDVLTSLALLYTATVTPFEASFMPSVVGSAAWNDPWFLNNRFLDILFFLDLCLQFFVAFQTGNSFGGYHWVTDHKRIVRNYLAGWFIIDSTTIFVPGGFDLYLASSQFDGGMDAKGGSRVSVLRALRVVRIFKLVRLVRASRVFQRWKSKINISYGTQTLLQCSFILFFSAHWYACIIALDASMHSSVQQTWMGADMYNLCDPNGSDAMPGHLEGCEHLDISSWYLASIAWSLMIITGTGGTDYYPSQFSDGETLIVTVLIVLGAFIWMKVLAAFCDVATNGDPALTNYWQQLDGLNAYIAFNNLPSDMARRMRSYMNQQKGMQLREELASRSIPSLSMPLQLEAVLYVHRKWLDSVWFIRNLESPVKVRLAMSMQQKVMAPGEIAPNRHLYVLGRGKIMFGGRCLSHGAVWGDDVILSNPINFLPYLARAITYVDVSVASRETLLEVVKLYPVSVRQLRRAQGFLGARRFMIQMARRIRELDNDESLVSSGRLMHRFDFMDLVTSAAADLLTDTESKSMDVALDLEKKGLSSFQKLSARPTGRLAPGEAAVVPSALLDSLNELKGLVRTTQQDIQELRQEVREVKERVAGPRLVSGARIPAIPAAS